MTQTTTDFLLFSESGLEKACRLRKLNALRPVCSWVGVNEKEVPKNTYSKFSGLKTEVLSR